MNAQSNSSGKFKTSLRELFPAFAIALALCYMLFVYEPMMLYATHQNDFWFDFTLMARPMLPGFLIFLGISFFVLAAAYFALGLFCGKKKTAAFGIVQIVVFGIMLVTFFQGNILSMNLPPLDGVDIEWKSLWINDALTLAVMLGICGLLVFFVIKFGINRTLKYAKIFSLGFCVFLTLIAVIEMICMDGFKRKDSIITTDKNFSTVSRDKNFVIFLCDAIGSVEFKGVLEDNPQYKEVFEDFTYYPDTLSGYPCTRDNIPLILGGQFNKNEKPFNDFSSETLNNSPLFKELDKNGYDINLYEPELIWYGSRSFDIKNGSDFKRYKLPLKSFLAEELKYVRFKYLPYLLKQYSRVESMDFNGLVDKFIWDDHTVYKNITDAPELEKTDRKMFSFVHCEGGHVPFKYDKDLNIIENGTYGQKIEATITMLNAYIERLKSNGAYDDTAIIILADHGNAAINSAEGMLERGNPMLLIKGFDERHSFTESEKPVSFADLTDIYCNLLNGSSSEEALSFINDSRERYYLWYRHFQFEYHMEEYLVADKAWEWEKFTKTGKVYDLH